MMRRGVCAGMILLSYFSCGYSVTYPVYFVGTFAQELDQEVVSAFNIEALRRQSGFLFERKKIPGVDEGIKENSVGLVLLKLRRISVAIWHQGLRRSF